MGRGGGTGVSIFAFYSGNLRSNPAVFYFSVLQKDKNK